MSYKCIYPSSIIIPIAVYTPPSAAASSPPPLPPFIVVESLSCYGNYGSSNGLGSVYLTGPNTASGTVTMQSYKLPSTIFGMCLSTVSGSKAQLQASAWFSVRIDCFIGLKKVNSNVSIQSQIKLYDTSFRQFCNRLHGLLQHDDCK